MPIDLMNSYSFHIDNTCNANEGPVRIQYTCLVPIYVFPEMKLLFPKHNYNVLSPSFYTHMYICERLIYTISRIGPPSVAGIYVN
jgi:hypothetical protein